MKEFKAYPSIASAYYKEKTPEEMIDLYLAADFHHAELAYEHLEFMLARAAEEGKTLEKEGGDLADFMAAKDFHIPQAHLSFKGDLFSEGRMELLKKELDLLLAMGVKNAVFHLAGGPDLSDEERKEKMVQTLSELLDYLKGTDLYLCIENLYRPACPRSVEDLLEYVKLLGDANLGICLDTGHLHISNYNGDLIQSQREFILGAGNHLRALHIANNDGRRDQHIMPFTSGLSVQWDEVMRALREIGYQGLFNLEIAGETHRFTCPFAVKVMKLRYLREMVGYMLTDEFAAWIPPKRPDQN